MSDPVVPSTFTLAYAPGVTPTKWVRVWHERLPQVRLELRPLEGDTAADSLLSGLADAAFVRLPVEPDDTTLSVIPLYTETSVVVVPKDHVICAADDIAVNDLTGETVLHPLDDTLSWDTLPGTPAVERPADTGAAVELVAAGIGVLVVPQSLARLHHRKDLTYRPVTDAPTSQIGLAWPQRATTELVEELIGIVRGRTANSSRGRESEPAPKRTASQKAAAKRARMQASGALPRGGAARPGRKRR